MRRPKHSKSWDNCSKKVQMREWRANVSLNIKWFAHNNYLTVINIRDTDNKQHNLLQSKLNIVIPYCDPQNLQTLLTITETITKKKKNLFRNDDKILCCSQCINNWYLLHLSCENMCTIDLPSCSIEVAYMQ